MYRYLGFVSFQNHDLEEISRELYAYLKAQVHVPCNASKGVLFNRCAPMRIHLANHGIRITLLISCVS